MPLTSRTLRPLFSMISMFDGKTRNISTLEDPIEYTIPNVTQTIPLAIYDYTNTPGGDANAMALCLVSVLLSFAVLMVSEMSARSLKKRREA